MPKGVRIHLRTQRLAKPPVAMTLALVVRAVIGDGCCTNLTRDFRLECFIDFLIIAIRALTSFKTL